MKQENIYVEKKKLRDVVREEFYLRGAAELVSKSGEIMTRFEGLTEFAQADTIALYWSVENEVHTHEFIEKWSTIKNILLPVVEGDSLVLKEFSCVGDMCRGCFGIMEPHCEAFPESKYGEIGIIMVPGVGFDAQGHRLGKGKGYYDRLLPLVRGMKVGVCFDFQLFGRIPVEEHDIRMDKIISNNSDRNF